ncbi:hypothetical protein H2201_008075 [Coniosporium apollinis]|uniref:Cryptic loci regulator 2 N-terminal domain-containing protein n=1 Tax=Coniosporium apollinis TaxID=61459 RepID=A0ABQ9NH69_9PEZI|nr:hypothetical protein H2201_008075 [Coniosporium apollinis]
MVVVPINPGSDGDSSHRPTVATHWPIDPPTIYLEKLAALWMASRGETVPGETYILDRLPDGYALYGKPRPGNPKLVDKWLFGHPSKKYFDSPNRFFPHFLHLMDNDGDSFGCPCTVCAAAGGKIPIIGSKGPKLLKPLQISGNGAGPKPLGRPKLLYTGKTDDEGNPDVYRNLIDKLKGEGRVDESIQEIMSMDWRAERKSLPAFLNKVSKQPMWMPRVAEVVLFVRKIQQDEEICYDKATKEFRVFNEKLGKFTSHPRWEAGVVGQTAAEDVSIEDLVTEPRKEYQVNYSGFRVEPLPDPNSEDKSLSKQYKYVPLHYTRPFIFWQEYLKGIPEDKWHPTIKHAFTAMSSFSLLEKFHFKGQWPIAAMSCKGIYIGSELIFIGDTVRLTPTTPEAPVTDVLKITSIKLHFSNLDLASSDDNDEGRPYNTTVHITGKAYTTDPSRAAPSLSKASIDPSSGLLPSCLDDSQDWYHLHDPSKFWRVPFNRILGRCFEPEALLLWLPTTMSAASSHSSASSSPATLTTAATTTPAHLTAGLSGTLHARHFATKHDRRIPHEDGKSWFWADHRAEALDLETLNGVELARVDENRDPKTWRALIRVMERVADERDRAEVKRAALAERPLRGYGGSAGGLVGAGLEVVAEEAGEAVEGRREKMSRSFAVADGFGGFIERDEDDEADELIERLAEGIDLESDEKMEDGGDDVDDEESVVEVESTPKRQRVEVVLWGDHENVAREGVVRKIPPVV